MSDSFETITEKKVELARLLTFYGPLLTDHQQQAVSLFAEDDWSFAEIAESFGVSKQSIFDTVSKAEKQLRLYESKLHLYRKYSDTSELLDNALGQVEHLRQRVSPSLVPDIDALRRSIVEIQCKEDM